MEYPKTYNPYKVGKSTKGLYDESKYADPVFKTLQNAEWVFTDKKDGMNIRVIWDGVCVEVKGRTDRANVPQDLIDNIAELFNAQSLESFSPCVFYGEGVGGKIQKMSHVYGVDKKFILFDVLMNEQWVRRESLESMAESIGCEIAEIVAKGTLQDGIQFVKRTDMTEGVVGVLPGIFNRFGKRVKVKIKKKYFSKEG